jgi:hypothetical protein
VTGDGHDHHDYGMSRYGIGICEDNPQVTVGVWWALLKVESAAGLYEVHTYSNN